VAHNHIHDLDYSGVSMGWVWGYGLSWARNNTVEANHIHDVGRRVLSDLAGVYTLGVSPGTVIRGNLIHDCYSWGYGGWGLYADEGSSYITLEKNVVYNTKTGGFHQHYGQENVVRNNVFAFGELQQLQRSRTEEHTSFTFERNIVYYRSGVLLAGSWKDDHFVADSNLYWDERWGSGARARAGSIDFDGGALGQWQRRGHDKKSVLKDPLFVDPGRGDFRLAASSPARALGFQDIDVSSVGPRQPVGPSAARPRLRRTGSPRTRARNRSGFVPGRC
jgi:parallel beta-helix repeat protein